MSQDWTPDAGPLSQLAQTIENSLSNDQNLRTQAFYALEEAKRVPELYNYLIWLLVKSQELSLQIRSGAGLVLKNCLKHDVIAPEVIESRLRFCKSQSFSGLRDDNALTKSISASIIDTIVVRFGIGQWPTVVSSLLGLLDSENHATVEGAMDAIAKICEDAPLELDRDFNGERPLNFIIPKLFPLVSHPVAKVRQYVIFCLNQLAIARTQAILMYIDQYLQAIFQMATDTNAGVRKGVCSGIITLVEIRPEKVQPSLDSIINYIMYCTQDLDTHVALEACEFWLALSEERQLCEGVRPYLPQIVPLLLKGMVYSDEDIALLDIENDNDDMEDRDQDIKPLHARSHARTGDRSTASRDSTEINKKNVEGGEIPAQSSDSADKESEDTDNEDGDYDDDVFSEWNFRKCSAAAFDSLSGIFPNEILSLSMTYFRENLNSTDWRRREACVLALGALAEGCLDGISPQLPELVPYLMSLLNDQKPLVRQITCWTLGRYSGWAVSRIPEDNKYFDSILRALLREMSSDSKSVQEAACSALATLETNAGTLLNPYIDEICGKIVECFEKYKKKNLLILYDALQTLAESVECELSRPYIIEMLMQPLIAKWHSIPDDDTQLFPLFEVMSSLIVAFGEGFTPFVQPVFQRCLNILQKVELQLHSNNGDMVEMPDKEFLVTALDLLSGLVVGIGPPVEQMVSNSNPPLMNLLGLCLHDEDTDVRQSAFALLGDLTMNAFPCLIPFFDEYIRSVIEELNLKEDAYSVCNNAAWVTGEIALKKGHDICEWTEALLKPLIDVLNKPECTAQLLENSAVAIGRLGLVTPELVAPHISSFAKPLLLSMLRIMDNEEKDSALRGFCLMLGQNPNSLSGFFPSFVTAVSMYPQPSSELANYFGEILRNYKPHFSEWNNFIANLSQDQQNRLGRYNV